MADNIMNEYLITTQKHMSKYIKLIFENDFKKAIFEKFWEIYLNSRYYDFSGDKSENTLKEDTLLELEKGKEKLLAELEKEKEDKKLLIEIKKESKLIEDMYLFFVKIIYFDKIVPNKDLDKSIMDIAEMRRTVLGKNDDGFKENLKNILKENEEELEELYKKYDSTEFYIKISNYKINNAYKVTLKYNFKMPMVYSDTAVSKAFDTGTVNEDKLVIEYNLISLAIVQDVIRGNLKKHYIVEFAESLFEKKQKLEKTLSIIDNPIVQDKISLKLTHAMFLKDKQRIYELMQRGFKFAIIIDNTFESSLGTLERLNMFSYILVDKETKWGYQIIESESLHNIIIV